MKKQMPNVGNAIAVPPCRPPARSLARPWLPATLVALNPARRSPRNLRCNPRPGIYIQWTLAKQRRPGQRSYDLTFSLYANNSGGTSVAGRSPTRLRPFNDGVFTARLISAQECSMARLTGWKSACAPMETRLHHSQSAARTNRHALRGLCGERPCRRADRTLPAAVLRGTYDNAMTLTNPGNTFAGDGTGLTNVNAVTLGWCGHREFLAVGRQ